MSTFVPLQFASTKYWGPFFILFINYTGDDKLSAPLPQTYFNYFLDQDKDNFLNINKYRAGFYC